MKERRRTKQEKEQKHWSKKEKEGREVEIKVKRKETNEDKGTTRDARAETANTTYSGTIIHRRRDVHENVA